VLQINVVVFNYIKLYFMLWAIISYADQFLYEIVEVYFGVSRKSKVSLVSESSVQKLNWLDMF
jgi:hypothetical protein